MSLKNLLIANWGPYDSSTGISGDFEFKSELQLVFFDEFGRVHSAGTPGAYDNPTFEYNNSEIHCQKVLIFDRFYEFH